MQFQLVVEGELKKRQQLSDDVERIGQWIEKTLKDTEGRVSGTVDLEDDFIEVNIFCLLYTSPSPRDATLSRMPSSA